MIWKLLLSFFFLKTSNFFMFFILAPIFHSLVLCFKFNDRTMKQTFGFHYHGSKCKYTFDNINFVNKIPSHNKGFKPLCKLHEINITITLLPMVKLKVHKVVILKNL
jgi:hypothetical protein